MALSLSGRSGRQRQVEIKEQGRNGREKCNEDRQNPSDMDEEYRLRTGTGPDALVQHRETLEAGGAGVEGTVLGRDFGNDGYDIGTDTGRASGGEAGRSAGRIRLSQAESTF